MLLVEDACFSCCFSVHIMLSDRPICQILMNFKSDFEGGKKQIGMVIAMKCWHLEGNYAFPFE